MIGFLGQLYSQQPDLYITLRIALGFAFGGAYGLLAMCLSMIVRSRYLALALPFVVFIAGGFAFNLLAAPEWYGAYALAPNNIRDSTAITVLAPLVLIVIASLLVIECLSRRENELYVP